MRGEDLNGKGNGSRKYTTFYPQIPPFPNPLPPNYSLNPYVSYTEARPLNHRLPYF
jgi:hypothetical protein